MIRQSFLVLALGACSAVTGNVTNSNIFGTFDSGPLAGRTISGVIAIDPGSFSSGTADRNPLTLGPTLTEMTWTIDLLGEPDLTFDLSVSDSASVFYDSGSSPSFSEIDYASSFNGFFLDIFDMDSNGTTDVSFEDVDAGEISTGSITIQPAIVPEPTALGCVFGAIAGIALLRRR